MTRADRETIRARFRAAMAGKRPSVRGVLGEYASGDWSRDRAVLVDIIDEARSERECRCVRELDHDEGHPCAWWWAPDVGLDRERHPWDPPDLIERMRAAQAAEEGGPA